MKTYKHRLLEKIANSPVDTQIQYLEAELNDNENKKKLDRIVVVEKLLEEKRTDKKSQVYTQNYLELKKQEASVCRGVIQELKRQIELLKKTIEFMASILQSYNHPKEEKIVIKRLTNQHISHSPVAVDKISPLLNKLGLLVSSNRISESRTLTDELTDKYFQDFTSQQSKTFEKLTSDLLKKEDRFKNQVNSEQELKTLQKTHQELQAKFQQLVEENESVIRKASALESDLGKVKNNMVRIDQFTRTVARLMAQVYHHDSSLLDNKTKKRVRQSIEDYHSRDTRANMNLVSTIEKAILENADECVLYFINLV